MVNKAWRQRSSTVQEGAWALTTCTVGLHRGVHRAQERLQPPHTAAQSPCISRSRSTAMRTRWPAADTRQAGQLGTKVSGLSAIATATARYPRRHRPHRRPARTLPAQGHSANPSPTCINQVTPQYHVAALPAHRPAVPTPAQAARPPLARSASQPPGVQAEAAAGAPHGRISTSGCTPGHTPASAHSALQPCEPMSCAILSRSSNCTLVRSEQDMRMQTP